MKRNEVGCCLSLELLGPGSIAKLDANSWDQLSLKALVENPFYSRDMLIPGLSTVDRDARLEALAIRDAHGRLVGFFPFRRRRLPLEVADAACNRYQFSCTPLVHQDCAEEVVDAWLNALKSSEGVPRFWRIQHVHLRSRFASVLDRALAQHHLSRRDINCYSRPQLVRLEGGFEHHISLVLSRRRRKDIERRIRRLRGLGHLRFERAREPRLVSRRLDQFLKLEHAGWKGSRGTSFLSKTGDAAFARAVFNARHAGGRSVTIDSLLLDEAPVAISLNLQAGDSTFTPKSAYDERLRQYSPGVVLDYFIIKTFYEDDEMVEMDAATTEEGHILSGMWNQAKSMGTMMIGPSGWRLRLVSGLDELQNRIRKVAKRLVAPAQAWASINLALVA